jgi:hypothetical protein
MCSRARPSLTTLFFIAACGVITFSLIYKFPLNSYQFQHHAAGRPLFYLGKAATRPLAGQNS